MEKSLTRNDLFEPLGIAAIFLLIVLIGLGIFWGYRQEIHRIESRALDFIDLVPHSGVLPPQEGYKRVSSSLAYDRNRGFSIAYPDSWELEEDGIKKIIYRKDGKTICVIELGVGGHGLSADAKVNRQPLFFSGEEGELMSVSQNGVSVLEIASVEKEGITYILEMAVLDGFKAQFCKDQFLTMLKTFRFE